MPVKEQICDFCGKKFKPLSHAHMRMTCYEPECVEKRRISNKQKQKEARDRHEKRKKEREVGGKRKDWQPRAYVNRIEGNKKHRCKFIKEDGKVCGKLTVNWFYCKTHHALLSDQVAGESCESYLVGG